MNDFKSKLPDIKELGSMAGKLFNGLKTSVCEIVDDYKKKRSTDETPTKAETSPKKSKPKAASAKKTTAKKQDN